MTTITHDSAATAPAQPAPPAGFDYAAAYGYAPPPGATRYDGWSPAKQRLFLEALSEGVGVTNACRTVGLTKQSAYALRGRAAGAAFAIGWQAAVLLGRQQLADDLIERARYGVTETITNKNGETIERHRHDNRLAMAMLTRMDRMADAAHGEASHAAARLVAADFDQFLAMIERDPGPARAGLFLNARVEEATADDLAPIRALGRADRWLRTRADRAGALDTSDLDPAGRSGWSAEQWARAEAAGLLVLAPNDADADSRDGNGQFGQAEADRGPVWWCDHAADWRTHFPPPDDFGGTQEGEYGDADYERGLTPAEQAAAEDAWRAGIETRAAAGARERDAWFGFAPAAPPRPAPQSQPQPQPDPAQEGAPNPSTGTRDPAQTAGGARMKDNAMSEEGHDLHAIFPEDGEALHRLKLENVRFRTLADRHHDLERELHAIESGLAPASDERTEALKRERLAGLDEIATLIAAVESS